MKHPSALKTCKEVQKVRNNIIFVGEIRTHECSVESNFVIDKTPNTARVRQLKHGTSKANGPPDRSWTAFKQQAELLLVTEPEPENDTSHEEALPERIAAFRKERRERQFGEEAVNLQRWDNIEDELGQMMDMLQESGTGTDLAFVEQLQKQEEERAEEYDFKYMYKYKYRALIIDDDQELPPLGPGQSEVNTMDDQVHP